MNKNVIIVLLSASVLTMCGCSVNTQGTATTSQVDEQIETDDDIVEKSEDNVVNQNQIDTSEAEAATVEETSSNPVEEADNNIENESEDALISNTSADSKDEESEETTIEKASLPSEDISFEEPNNSSNENDVFDDQPYNAESDGDDSKGCIGDDGLVW